jgi:hypothetical protein
LQTGKAVMQTQKTSLQGYVVWGGERMARPANSIQNFAETRFLCIPIRRKFIDKALHVYQ